MDTPQGGRKRHWVWKHFERLTPSGKKTLHGKCNKCGDLIAQHVPRLMHHIGEVYINYIWLNTNAYFQCKNITAPVKKELLEKYKKEQKEKSAEKRENVVSPITQPTSLENSEMELDGTDFHYDANMALAEVFCYYYQSWG